MNHEERAMGFCGSLLGEWAAASESYDRGTQCDLVPDPERYAADALLCRGTWGPRGLREHLSKAGFEIDDVDAVMHCPRVLAVAAAFILERIAPRPLQKLFLRGLSFFEVLKYLPTRFLPGHFVAVKATKRSSGMAWDSSL